MSDPSVKSDESSSVELSKKLLAEQFVSTPVEQVEEAQSFNFMVKQLLRAYVYCLDWKDEQKYWRKAGSFSVKVDITEKKDGSKKHIYDVKIQFETDNTLSEKFSTSITSVKKVSIKEEKIKLDKNSNPPDLFMKMKKGNVLRLEIKNRNVGFLFRFENEAHQMKFLIEHFQAQKDDKKQPEFYRSPNEIFLLGKRLKYVGEKNKKKKGDDGESLMTKGYETWDKDDFLNFLNCAPCLVGEKSNRRRRLTLFDWFSESLGNGSETFADRLVKKIFDEGNKIKSLYEDIKKKKTTLLDFLELDDNDVNEMKCDLFEKYLEALVYLTKDRCWSFSFQKVLEKMMDFELKLGDKEGRDPKSTYNLLSDCMTKFTILWDADECRDHLCALFFLRYPILSDTKKQSIKDDNEIRIDDTFGESVIKTFNKKLALEEEETKKKDEEVEGECEDEVFAEEMMKEIKKPKFENQLKKYNILKSFLEGKNIVLRNELFELPTGIELSPEKYYEGLKEQMKKVNIELDKIDYSVFEMFEKFEWAKEKWEEVCNIRKELKELFKPEEDLSEEDSKTIKDKVAKLYGIIKKNFESETSHFEFLRSESRRKEIKKVLDFFGEEVENQNERDTGSRAIGIVTKLILSEIYRKGAKVDNMMYAAAKMVKGVSSVFTGVKGLRNCGNFFKYGYLHASLCLRDVQLHWYSNGFVKIRRMRITDSEREFFCVDNFTPVMGTYRHIYDIIDQLTQQIMVFNSITPYGAWGLTKEKDKPQNCQRVCDGLFQILCRSGKFHQPTNKFIEHVGKIAKDRLGSIAKGSVCAETLKDVRFIDFKDFKDFCAIPEVQKAFFEFYKWQCKKNGTRIPEKEMTKYEKKNALFFKKKPARIFFETHEEVDTLYSKLVEAIKNFDLKHSNVKELLKGFCRSFHMLEMKRVEGFPKTVGCPMVSKFKQGGKDVESDEDSD